MGALQGIRDRYRHNDAVWMLYHVLERGAHRAGAEGVSRRLRRRATERQIARGLPGTNTRAANRAVWNSYDWSRRGEEWSHSPEWLQALISEVMLPNVPPAAVALEIGPGAGRWSEALQRGSRELILVDVSERALELCRERFGGLANVTLHLTDGASLPGVGDATVDFVWSFDVFVHIAPDDQRSYLSELARVMRPGARGVIHHVGGGGVDVDPYHWRSSMTSELFSEFLAASGLELIERRDRWGPDGEYAVPEAGDVISVFQR